MQPFLVIARSEVRCLVHLLDVVAGATGNRDWRGNAYGEHTPFPVVVKHWFVLLPHNGTKPVHPSHIVNTVHAASPPILTLARLRRRRAVRPVPRDCVGAGGTV